jgi:hypothetical protein
MLRVGGWRLVWIPLRMLSGFRNDANVSWKVADAPRPTTLRSVNTTPSSRDTISSFSFRWMTCRRVFSKSNGPLPGVSVVSDTSDVGRAIGRSGEPGGPFCEAWLMVRRSAPMPCGSKWSIFTREPDAFDRARGRVVGDGCASSGGSSSRCSPSWSSGVRVIKASCTSCRSSDASGIGMRGMSVALWVVLIVGCVACGVEDDGRDFRDVHDLCSYKAQDGAGSYADDRRRVRKVCTSKCVIDQARRGGWRRSEQNHKQDDAPAAWG